MTCKWRLIIFTSSAQSRLDARKRGQCIGVPTLLIFSRTFLPAKRYRMFLRMFSRFSLWSELELGSDSYSIHSTRRKYKKNDKRAEKESISRTHESPSIACTPPPLHFPPAVRIFRT